MPGMKLPWPFGCESDRGEDASDVAEAGSAVAYVDWLLAHMLQTSQTTLQIDSAAPLPCGADMTPRTRPPVLPTPGAVINRLKFLSGLNPVVFAQAMDGRFEQSHRTYALVFDTRFVDSPGRFTCTIRLRVRRLMS